MKTLKQFLIPALLGILIITCIYGCVMILAVHENVRELEQNDKNMTQLIQSGNLEQPDSIPKLTDSLAYYKSERKLVECNYKNSWVTIHRFFFKRAEYTQKLYSGFSIIVAEFDTQKILVESQDNVTLATTNLGDATKDWETKLDALTTDKDSYVDFSDDGLKVRTYIRSNKF